MSPEVLERLAIGEDGLVFDSCTGHSFRLNETALFILKKLAGGLGPEAVLESVVERYEVDHPRAERELMAFRERLRALGLGRSDAGEAGDGGRLPPEPFPGDNRDPR